MAVTRSRGRNCPDDSRVQESGIAVGGAVGEAAATAGREVWVGPVADESTSAAVGAELADGPAAIRGRAHRDTPASPARTTAAIPTRTQVFCQIRRLARRSSIASAI